MTTSQPKQGLRDRKRAQTLERIESAAVELVLRDGLDAATVEAISERAGISPRTFFNYFDSKDSAILGIRPGAHEEEFLEQQLADLDPGETDPVVQTVRLVAGVMSTGARAGTRLHRDRMRLIRSHPQILGSQFAQLNARRTALAKVTVRLLDGHPNFRNQPDAELLAGLVLSLCMSAVKAATDEWFCAADDSATPEPDLGDDLADVTQITDRAIALVRTTARSLA